MGWALLARHSCERNDRSKTVAGFAQEPTITGIKVAPASEEIATDAPKDPCATVPCLVLEFMEQPDPGTQLKKTKTSPEGTTGTLPTLSKDLCTPTTTVDPLMATLI